MVAYQCKDSLVTRIMKTHATLAVSKNLLNRVDSWHTCLRVCSLMLLQKHVGVASHVVCDKKTKNDKNENASLHAALDSRYLQLTQASCKQRMWADNLLTDLAVGVT